MKTYKAEIQHLVKHDYQMFTTEGGQAMAALVDALEAGIKAGFLNSDNLAQAALAGRDQIEKTHGEVTDTEPRGLLFWLVGNLAHENGLDTAKVITNLGLDWELWDCEF